MSSEHNQGEGGGERETKQRKLVPPFNRPSVLCTVVTSASLIAPQQTCLVAAVVVPAELKHQLWPLGSALTTCLYSKWGVMLPLVAAAETVTQQSR